MLSVRCATCAFCSGSGRGMVLSVRAKGVPPHSRTLLAAAFWKTFSARRPMSSIGRVLPPRKECERELAFADELVVREDQDEGAEVGEGGEGADGGEGGEGEGGEWGKEGVEWFDEVGNTKADKEGYRGQWEGDDEEWEDAILYVDSRNFAEARVQTVLPLCPAVFPVEVETPLCDLLPLCPLGLRI